MKQELSRLNNTFNKRAYRPSLSAALIITAPSQLLNIALGSLLTGFGVYFGFVYSARLPAIGDNNSALAVLAVYVASASSGLLFFSISPFSSSLSLRCAIEKGTVWKGKSVSWRVTCKRRSDLICFQGTMT